MVNEVIISNEKEFEEKKKNFIQGGADKIHVVSDFDRTVTYGVGEEGKRTETIISQLRSDESYLGKKYFDGAHKLFDIYHPIKIDGGLSLEEKTQKMREWWEKHFKLIAKSGLTKKLIEKVVKEKPLKFRKGLSDFLNYLDDCVVPLVFISAAPGDMLVEYLKQNNFLYSNVHIISNLYDFDENGRALNIREPIIHTFNKSEITVKNYPLYSFIENRKNVILMGDSIGDVGMVEGFDYDNLIKIGFLNENIKENLNIYKENFDVVLTGDQDFDYVNKLVREILK